MKDASAGSIQGQEPSFAPLGIPVREADGKTAIGYSVADLTQIVQQLTQVSDLRAAAPDHTDDECPPGNLCWDDENGWHGGDGFLVWAIIIAIVTGGFLLKALYEALKGTMVVSASSFPNLAGGDNDRIEFSLEDGPPGTFTVTLGSLGSTSGYFKGVEVHRFDGHVEEKLNGYFGAWTQDNRRHDSTSVDVPDPDDMKNWFLVFVKGKTFNVHSRTYSWVNLRGFEGKQMHFNWMQD